MLFHEQSWTLLRNDQKAEMVPLKNIFILLRILLDPNPMSTKQMSKILKSFFQEQMPNNRTYLNSEWSLGTSKATPKTIKNLSKKNFSTKK